MLTEVGLAAFKCLLLFFFFFFFQAEDGIRDGTVTGVQTCALPILILKTFSGGLNDMRRMSRSFFSSVVRWPNGSRNFHSRRGLCGWIPHHAGCASAGNSSYFLESFGSSDVISSIRRATYFLAGYRAVLL